MRRETPHSTKHIFTTDPHFLNSMTDDNEDRRSSGILRGVDCKLYSDISGQPIGLPLKMRPMGCAETSVMNSLSTLRRISE